jgi:hypothetical protein
MGAPTYLQHDPTSANVTQLRGILATSTTREFVSHPARHAGTPTACLGCGNSCRHGQGLDIVVSRNLDADARDHLHLLLLQTHDDNVFFARCNILDGSCM